MASTTFYYCILCHEDCETVSAVTWCPECETFLCSNCEKYHGRIKVSKQHQIVLIEDYRKLPKCVLQANIRCDNHDQRLELYCSFHATACCKKCLKDQHNGCKDISSLTDVIGNIKSSAHVSQLKTDYQYLIGQYDEIIKYLSNRSSIAKQQKAVGVAKIHSFRKSINDHLDKLEKILIDNLNTQHTKVIFKTEQLTAKVEAEKKKVDQLESDLENMTRYATDLQTFFGIKDLEKMKDASLDYLENLKRGNDLNEIKLEVNIAHAVGSIVTDIETFGTLSTQSIPSSLRLKESKMYQTQLVPAPKISADKIKPTLQKSFQIGIDVMITGCVILPNEQMLFVDGKSKSLLLFDKEGTYSRQVIKFGLEPEDICYVKNTTVALTTIQKETVMFINVSNGELIKKIDVEMTCSGIDSNGKQVIVAPNHGNTVIFMDLNGNNLRRLRLQCGFITRIFLSEDKIYCSDSGNDQIICYNVKGEFLQKYQHQSIKIPFKIMCDSNGFIYVACQKSSKIVLLTENKIQNVLSSNDGLDNPCAMHINVKRSTLLVANLFKGTAFLFQI